MRKVIRGGPLGYGLFLVVLAALAIAGAASGNHWADYNGTADSHELVEGNPPLCPSTEGGISFRVDANDLTEGGRRTRRSDPSSGSSTSTSTGER